MHLAALQKISRCGIEMAYHSKWNHYFLGYLNPHNLEGLAKVAELYARFCWTLHAQLRHQNDLEA